MNKRKNTFFYGLLLAILLVLMGISYTIGTADISKKDAIQFIFTKIPGLKHMVGVVDIPSSLEKILLNLRLPRVLLASLVGASLSVVGAVFQGMFTNPLAEPYVLGVSAGANLGATIVIVYGASEMMKAFSSVSLFAALGAILTVILVLGISNLHGGNMTTMLLTGIAFSYFASSLSTILMVLNRDKIERISLWSLGSFSHSTWNKVGTVAPILLLGMGILFFFSRELNAMSLGEETAIGLGIPIQKLRYFLLAISTVMVAMTVAAAGIIGFVGLIIPAATRLIFGSDFKNVIPASCLLGAIFLLLCDTLARLFQEIPAGAITALIGTPIFIYLAVQQAKGQVK